MESNSGKEPKEYSTRCYSSGIYWWATLSVAVLAVPSFGFVVSFIFPFRGVGELVVFVLACWLCTYLGMRSMDNPKMSKKIDFHKKDT